MPEINHTLFISYGSQDAELAGTLAGHLERLGFPCWLTRRDALPGAPWSTAILAAISASHALILVHSAKSNSSGRIAWELDVAFVNKIPIIAYRIEQIQPVKSMERYLASAQSIDASGPDFSGSLQLLEALLRRYVPRELIRTEPASPIPEKRPDKSKGYVFISYVRNDAGFVQRLRTVLESKKYGYWDYAVGSRDYHGTLYRELEERIDGAEAFMSIVSDDWRTSDWVASEFIYAREAKIPIFVIQAQKLSRPLPILLNLQTRIDMSADFERGAQALTRELAKKGL
jgi:hypothetical protein